MSYSARELQMGVQSLMIYMIMAIIDQDEQTKQRGTRLLDTVEVRFPVTLDHASFGDTQLTVG